MFNKSGIFIIDKQSGWTTNDVIQKIKHKFDIRKIGHAGTLDPLATGVVICLVNNATKISDFLINDDKQYLFTIKLFEATDSYDSDGKIINSQTPFEITIDNINKVIKKYNKITYDQSPPIYSAIKVKGKKLYEYARNQIDVEIKTRKVKINNLKLINFDGKNITLEVECSKGTYVRSLAVDIAKDLATIGHIVNLRRIRSGNFDIKFAKTVDNIKEDNLFSIKQALILNNQKIIKYNNIRDINFGKKIIIENIKEDLVFIEDDDENILACYERENKNLFKCKRGGLNN